MTLGIYGSGGVGREAEELARLFKKWSEIVFIDDMAAPGSFHGIRRMPFELFQKKHAPESTEVIIAIGEPSDRKDLFVRVKKVGYPLVNLIHPGSHVSSSARMGTGVMVQKEAFIGCDVTIGDNVHIEPGVFIGHDSVVGDHCVFASKAALGGKVSVGETVFVGLGSSIRDRITIGKRTVIGMGAVVIEEVPDDSIAIGQPAKITKRESGRKVFQ